MLRGLIIAIFLTSSVLSLGMGKRKKVDLAITFHIEGDASEAPQFAFSRAEPNSSKMRYFAKVPEFTVKEIEWFYPFTAGDGTTFGVVFKLDAKGTRRLENLSARSLGRRLLTIIHPDKSSTLVIDRVVSDGVIVFWDGLTQAHIEILREGLEEWKGTPPER